jgi:hypothetical protein
VVTGSRKFPSAQLLPNDCERSVKSVVRTNADFQSARVLIFLVRAARDDLESVIRKRSVQAQLRC